MTGFVWLDGHLVPEATARIAIDNRGFTSGDGVFETLKIVEGVPFAITRHLERLRSSIGRLGLECVDEASLREAIAATVNANRDRIGPVGRLRITLTGRHGLGFSRASGPATLLITAAPAVAQPESVAVISVAWPRNERAFLAGVKTTSYAEGLAILGFAQSRGADEALLPDTMGRLSEGTTCNVALEYEGRLVTPTLQTGCLPGVTRALALDWGLIEAADVPIEALTETSEILITSSTRDLMPVSSINGRELRSRGPLASAAISAFRGESRLNPDP